jgi:hypothetical protein
VAPSRVGPLRVSVACVGCDVLVIGYVRFGTAGPCIFGEYVLLNQVESYKSKCILVIIHCFKKYNTLRTEKYLNFAIDTLNCKLPYAVFSNAEWTGLVKNNSKTKLINIIKKRSKPIN